jgi:hypothetical protein
MRVSATTLRYLLNPLLVWFEVELTRRPMSVVFLTSIPFFALR